MISVLLILEKSDPPRFSGTECSTDEESDGKGGFLFQKKEQISILCF